jgi:hypothetical protein
MKILRNLSNYHQWLLSPSVIPLGKKKVNNQQLLEAVIISVLEFLSSLEYNDRHILSVYPCVMYTMNSDREKGNIFHRH